LEVGEVCRGFRRITLRKTEGRVVSLCRKRRGRKSNFGSDGKRVAVAQPNDASLGSPSTRNTNTHFTFAINPSMAVLT
jgi:hypothetical protein